MSHHAVCYVGLELARERVPHYFAEAELDIHRIESSDFGIDEARELQRQANTNPIAAPVQTFVVVTEKITMEAQNALLKLFEEPPTRSQFCLVVPKRGLLLPTLQSRLNIEEGSATAGLPETFTAFQKATLGQRMSQVAAISKEKDREAIEDIVLGAEVVAMETGEMTLLRTVLFVREHIAARGASVKMLLEALALALPQK